MVKSRLFLIVFLGLSFGVMAQNTRWNGFFDINSIYSDSTHQNAFKLGQLDLYITSDITDRISVLVETTFALESGENFKTVVERAIIKYEVDNYLNFLVGKHHTPVSYWNNTYHHGRVLQPTAIRPVVFEYGLFPFHTTGLIVNGDFIGKKNFGYQVMVGQPGHEPNHSTGKHLATSASVHFEPAPDFKVMLSAYNDVIMKGELVKLRDTLKQNVNQNLISMALSYFPSEKSIEFLSELMWINNSMKSTSTGNIGGYAYIGYSTKKKWTPYYRFDYINTDKQDPYFLVDKFSSNTIGLRYSFNYLSNIKVELIETDSKIYGVNRTLNIQFGIGF